MIRRISKRIKKFWAALALLSVEMIILLVVFLAALIVFILVTRHIFVLKDENFDYRVFDYMKGFVSEQNNRLMLFITYLGKHDFLIPANIALIVFFIFIKKHRWFSIKIPAIALSSLALMLTLKNLFGRNRPDIPLLEEAKGLSFPSGHALMSVTFYGLLIYVIWNTVKLKWLKWLLTIFFIILIFMIGVSRIYLRVHYPSDVIAGFAVGSLWLVVAIYTVKRIEKLGKRKLEPVVQAPTVYASEPGK
jgi:undecaprenyl-diphosphatase